ncbi:MAG: hypothetical protein ACLUPL_04260 [Butyricimonas virosa]
MPKREPCKSRRRETDRGYYAGFLGPLQPPGHLTCSLTYVPWKYSMIPYGCVEVVFFSRPGNW